MGNKAINRVKECIEATLFGNITAEEYDKAEKLYKKQGFSVAYHPIPNGTEVSIYALDTSKGWSSGRYIEIDGRKVFESDELYSYLDNFVLNK